MKWEGELVDQEPEGPAMKLGVPSLNSITAREYHNVRRSDLSDPSKQVFYK